MNARDSPPLSHRPWINDLLSKRFSLFTMRAFWESHNLPGNNSVNVFWDGCAHSFRFEYLAREGKSSKVWRVGNQKSDQSRHEQETRQAWTDSPPLDVLFRGCATLLRTYLMTSSQINEKIKEEEGRREEGRRDRNCDPSARARTSSLASSSKSSHAFFHFNHIFFLE